MFRHLSSAIQSKGSQAPKAHSMGELASRRDMHLGQFFSPLWVVRGLYTHYLSQLEAQALGQSLSIFDNAMGSGNLFHFAKPDKYSLYGCDIDEKCIDAITEDAKQAGFDFEFLSEGMESIRADNMDIGIINPPFGLTLKHPDLIPFSHNTHGIFGPFTHALSHEYSLSQALDSCRVVIAILPASMRDFVYEQERLIACLTLPRNTFFHENANVSTFVGIFGATNRTKNTPIITGDIKQNECWPFVPLVYKSRRGIARLSSKDVDISTPSITLPVTHNNKVELHHHHRKIVMKFHCGLTQAKVMNHLLVKRSAEPTAGRRPKGLEYKGSGRLLLDVYLLQDDPEKAFSELLNDIYEFGGLPKVSPTLMGYFKKLIKRHQRQVVPNSHVIQMPDDGDLSVTCRKMRLVDIKNPSLGLFKKGQTYQATQQGNYFCVEIAPDKHVNISREVFVSVFGADAVQGNTQNDMKWSTVHEGLTASHKHVIQNMKANMKNAGVDFLWPCQTDAVAELLAKPYGCIAGHQQGCGKSRQAMALALSLSGKALVTVAAGLIDEMQLEVEQLGFSDDIFQTIGNDWDGKTLKKINLISYTRLRQHDAYFAKKLRHRISTLICDEATVLSSSSSLQTKAIKQVAGRRVYGLSGTPIRNYPRNVLPMVSAVMGSGVAHQVYGMEGKPYLHKNLINHAHHSVTGIHQFTDDFVCVEWSVNTFKDSLEEGAKREIPRINNVPIFRSWLQGNLQRRLRDEPAFAPYASCPSPRKSVEAIEWDEAHFYHHLKAFVEFQRWFEQYKKTLDITGQKANLFAILAKLRGVDDATNRPSHSDIGANCYYHPLTSKQRRCIEMVKVRQATGIKTIVFGNSPDVMKRLHAQALQQGFTKSFVYIGESPPKERAGIIKAFRACEGGVMFISYGCGDKGLNLPQVKSILMYDRSYSHETEDQAIARTQRPQQTDHVEVVYLELAGSIDSYKKQMVEFKAGASAAGLDYGENQEGAFYHIEHFINEFVEQWTGKTAYQFVVEYKKVS